MIKIFKKLKIVLLTFSLAVVTACAYLGIQQPTSFNDRVAIAQVTVNGARQSSFDLLKVKKISPDDAQNVQTQADTAQEGINVARAYRKSGNVGAADTKLESISSILKLLQAYIVTKEGSK